MTSFSLNQPPTAKICCNTSTCPPESCTAYKGDVFTLYNASTDPDGNSDITSSAWDVLGWGANPDLSCSGICNYTPPVPPGTWTVLLTITDSAGHTATATKTFTIKEDIFADFQCSLNPTDPSSWTDCQGFRVRVNQTLYLRDTSTPSEGATITSRFWTFSGGNPATSTLPNPSVTFSTTGDKIVTLSVTDSAGRTATAQKTIKVSRYPIWFPIPPSY